MDSFLDTGVVLGYCLYLDKHGVRCRRYVNDSIIGGSQEGFKSSNVDREFQHRCNSKIPVVRKEVLTHRQSLLKSSLEGSLDALDLVTAVDKHIDDDWDVAEGLNRWYENEVDPDITLGELTDRVRKFEQSIEARLKAEKSKLEGFLTTISRTKSYASVESKLTRIPSDDRQICLDAHHLRISRGAELELATTNPVHLIDGGRATLITNETAIDDIRDLSI